MSDLKGARLPLTGLPAAPDIGADSNRIRSGLAECSIVRWIPSMPIRNIASLYASIASNIASKHKWPPQELAPPRNAQVRPHLLLGISIGAIVTW